MTAELQHFLVITPIVDVACKVVRLDVFAVEAASLDLAESRASKIIGTQRWWEHLLCLDAPDAGDKDGYYAGEPLILPAPADHVPGVSTAALLHVPAWDEVVHHEDLDWSAAESIRSDALSEDEFQAVSEPLERELLRLLDEERFGDACAAADRADALLYDRIFLSDVDSLARASATVRTRLEELWRTAAIEDLVVTSRNGYSVVRAPDGAAWVTDRTIAVPPPRDSAERQERARLLETPNVARAHGYRSLLASTPHVGSDESSLHGPEARDLVRGAISGGLLSWEEARNWWPLALREDRV